MNSICNDDLEENIELVANPTRSWTNGEYLDYKKTCALKDININSYYNNDVIANISSIGEIRKMFKIAMDTTDGDFIKVFIKNNKLMKFNKYEAGVYYHDKKGEENKIKDIKR